MAQEIKVTARFEYLNAMKAVGEFSNFTNSQMKKVEDFVVKSAKRQADQQKREAEDNAKFQRQTMEKLLADETRLIAQENKKRQREIVLENKAILAQAEYRAKEQAKIQKEYDRMSAESSKKRQQEAVLENKAILAEATNRAKEQERIQKEYDKLSEQSSKRRQAEAALEAKVTMAAIEARGKAAEKLARQEERVAEKRSNALKKLGTEEAQQYQVTLASMEKYIQSQEGMSNAVVKATGIVHNAAGAFQTYTATVKNSDGTVQHYKYSVDQTTGTVYKLDQGARTATTGMNQFARATTTAINQLKMLVGFAGVTSVLRSAFNEMKAMSDELITYQKVTGATAAEVAKVRASAYQSAGRYGQTPSDFLASVAVMARAGYGEQSEAMADLATKTQLVGDMTSEAASKFLIAVDAGYQLKGNIDDLNNVLDKANIIDNNYATSLSKVADAMTLIAPLSASMNVSIEETMAAIGTMSAVTQREGTEVARAYRMIALNIAKDTETEVEEGVKLTEEEIKSLNDILQVYAKEELKAADAAGKLLSPMKAIEAIARAWKNGTLNEQELFKVLQGIGGARYTNSIMALVKNFDMYEDMLSKFVTEMGSADAEVEAMTKGWTAKFNQLKVAWTEMVNNAVSEDFIRQLLDIAKGFIQWTSNLQTFTGVVGGASVALKSLKAIITGSDSVFKGFGLTIGLVTVAISALNAASEQRKRAAQQEAAAALDSTKKEYEKARSIEALTQAYQALAEDGTIDTTELSEAESIQKEINTLVGELSGQYDLVAGSIDKNVEALKRMNEQQRAAASISAREAVNTSGHALVENGKDWMGVFTGLDTEMGSLLTDPYMTNAFEGSQYFRYGRYGAGIAPVVQYTGEKTAEAIVAAYDELCQIIDQATAADINSEGYHALIKTRNEWTELVTSYREALDYYDWISNGDYTKGAGGTGGTGGAGGTGGTGGKEDPATTWDRLAHSIKKATEAKEAFDKANETTKADQANDYASVYATLAEELANGKVNSTATHAALRMLLGAEAYDATGGNVQALQAAWTGKKAGQKLSAAESYEILTGTYTNQAGQTVEGAGIAVLAEKVGMQVKDELGRYMLDFTDSAKLEELSAMTGVTVDALRSALNAYDQYDIYGTNTGEGHPQEQDPALVATQGNTDALEAETTALQANTDAVNALTSAMGGTPTDGTGGGGGAEVEQPFLSTGNTSWVGSQPGPEGSFVGDSSSSTGKTGKNLTPGTREKPTREKLDWMIQSGEAVVVEQPNGTSIIVPKEDADNPATARVLGISRGDIPTKQRPEGSRGEFRPYGIGIPGKTIWEQITEGAESIKIKESAKSIVSGAFESIQEEESQFDVTAHPNGVGASSDAATRAQATAEDIAEVSTDVGRIADEFDEAANEDLAFWRAMARGAETGDFSGYNGPEDVQAAYEGYKRQYGDDVMDFIYDNMYEASNSDLTRDQKALGLAIQPILDKYSLEDIISSLNYDLKDELRPVVIDAVLNKYSLTEVINSLELVTDENRTAIINAAVAKYGKDAVIAELKKIASNNGGGWAAEIIAYLDGSSKEQAKKELKQLTKAETKTIYTKLVTARGGPVGVEATAHEAVGTAFFHGGSALVNDGTGAELVVDSHGAHVYGGGRPTITNIESGAAIYTAEQTRRLINSIPHHATGADANAAAQLAAELNAFFDYIRTGDTSYTLAGSAGAGAAGSAANKKASADDQWDKLKELIEYIIKRLGKALEAQEKVIDEQIQALQAQKSQRDEQSKIEELQKAVAEAQSNLAEAQSQRSVRYIDDNGQWHWMADQKKVQEAQKALDEANKNFVDYLYEVSIDAQVKALEDEKTRLSDEYTGYKDLWSDILDAVATPTGDLVALIQYLTANGTGAQRNGANAVRSQLITAMLGGSYSANYNEALGEIGKAAANNPSVPGISDAALAALIASSGTSVSNSAMLGALQSIAGSNAAVGSVGGSVTSTDNSIQYYINGVQIGSNMASMPLSEVLQCLSVYANASR